LFCVTDYTGFLVYSKVTGIESINLYNSSDKNDPIPPIKNETSIRNVIGLTFDFEHDLLFYSDIVRGDLQAYNRTSRKSWVVVDGMWLLQNYGPFSYVLIFSHQYNRFRLTPNLF